jgi:hypothetical protein
VVFKQWSLCLSCKAQPLNTRPQASRASGSSGSNFLPIYDHLSGWPHFQSLSGDHWTPWATTVHCFQVSKTVQSQATPGGNPPNQETTVVTWAFSQWAGCYFWNSPQTMKFLYWVGHWPLSPLQPFAVCSVKTSLWMLAQGLPELQLFLVFQVARVTQSQSLTGYTFPQPTGSSYTLNTLPLLCFWNEPQAIKLALTAWAGCQPLGLLLFPGLPLLPKFPPQACSTPSQNLSLLQLPLWLSPSYIKLWSDIPRLPGLWLLFAFMSFQYLSL